MYRQVLDLYATSVDYDPHSIESLTFFKIVQNKLHFAAHGHTAAEVIYERADAEQPFMGLTSFAGNSFILRGWNKEPNFVPYSKYRPNFGIRILLFHANGIRSPVSFLIPNIGQILE